MLAKGKSCAPRYDGPYFVEQLLSNNNLLLWRNRGRKLIRVHVNRVKIVPTTPFFGLENNKFDKLEGESQRTPSPETLAGNTSSATKQQPAPAARSENADYEDKPAATKSGSCDRLQPASGSQHSKRKYKRRPLPAPPDGPRTRGDHRRL